MPHRGIVTIDDVLHRLDDVHSRGDGWVARCPAHDDSRPSLAVDEGDKHPVVLHCYAGCSFTDVVQALGVDPRELGRYNPEPKGRCWDVDTDPGYTLRDYAEEKNLPADQLRSWGVDTVERDSRRVLAIPYRDASGEADGTKLRAGESFWWDSYSALPYGLDRLADADEGRAVLLVEGESDCHACWHHDVLALGVPGANSWRPAWADLLDGRDIYVWREPDDGGATFVESVTADLPDVRVIEAPEDAEDPAALHRLEPDSFRARLETLKHGARSVDTVLERPEGSEGEEHAPAVRCLARLLDEPDALAAPEPVVPRFAWRGRSSMLAAREKMGKSTLGTAMGAAVSRGRRFLGGPTAPGRVLWVGLEEAEGDMVRRCVEFGANPSNIFVLQRLGAPFEDLEHAFDEVRPSLVIVDTLASFVETIAPASGEASEWTPIMNRLTRLVRGSDAGLLLHHHGKKDGGQYRDSTAIGAGVDVILEMSQGDDSSVRDVKARGRFESRDFSVALRKGDDATTLVDEDGTPWRYELVAGDLSLEERVLRHVRENPGSSTRQVRENVTGNSQDIGDALDKLAEDGEIEDRSDNPNTRAWYVTEDSGSGDAGESPPGTGLGTGARSDENPEGTAPEPVSGTGAVPRSGGLGDGSGNRPGREQDGLGNVWGDDEHVDPEDVKVL